MEGVTELQSKKLIFHLIHVDWLTIFIDILKPNIKPTMLWPSVSYMSYNTCWYYFAYMMSKQSIYVVNISTICMVTIVAICHVTKC